MAKRKSSNDIYAQVDRIAEYYGDDSPQTQRALEIAERYEGNLNLTAQRKRDWERRNRVASLGGDWQAEADRMYSRKFSRNTYMGNANT